MSDLDRALAHLDHDEGRFANVKEDRGGRTYRGVTQANFTRWLQKHGKPARSVSTMTDTERVQLYDEEYWDTARCDLLPWPISYIAFDISVHCGPLRARFWLQEALGVKADGKIGPQTLAAARKAVAEGDASIVLKYVTEKADHHATDIAKNPEQVKFLKGWWRRTLKVQARALVDLVNEG